MAVFGTERRDVDAPLRQTSDDPVRATLEQRRARQHHQQQRQVAVLLHQLGHEVERTVIGPVQVVEQHDQWRVVARRKPAQHFPGGLERAVADLPAVTQHAAQQWAGREVEPDQVAEQVRRQLAFVLEQRRHAVDELAPRELQAVAVGDLEAPRDQVAQQSVRSQHPVGLGSAEQQPERPRMRLQCILKLGQQATFAEAGIADDDESLQPTFDQHRLEALVERRQLSRSPDHRRLQPVDAARGHAEGARLDTLHEVSQEWLVVALDGERRLLFDVEHTANVTVGVSGDAQPAGRRGLLHARGDVHRGAHRGVLGLDAATDEHAAGVHAHAHLEAGDTVLLRDLPRMPLAFFEQGQTGAHGALGVVLAGTVGAERGEQAVAHETQHPALVSPDHGSKPLQRVVDDGVRVFGVELPADRGRADDIGEQNADHPEMSGLAAIGHVEPAQLGPQRRQRQLDHVLAEHRALGQQRADPGFELFALAHRTAFVLRTRVLAQNLNGPLRGPRRPGGLMAPPPRASQACPEPPRRARALAPRSGRTCSTPAGRPGRAAG